MIITLNPATIGGAPPLAQYITLARKFGFDGVDFSIDEAISLGAEKGMDGVKALFDEADVQPAVFGLPIDWRGSNASFAEGLQALKAKAEAAQVLGTTRTCTWLPPAIGDDPLHFRSQSRDRFRQIAAVLGDYGIRLGLEWVGPYTLRHGPKAMGPNEFIWNMPGLLELIADIDAPHDNVGLLADSFHWFTTGATRADMEALEPSQIVYVHINDAPDKPRDQQMDGERLQPGDGVIDLRAFLGALRAIGYDGPIASEVLGSALGALGPDEATRRAMEAVRAVVTLR
jgi:sugar phosphate isomerase/epimerase